MAEKETVEPAAEGKGSSKKLIIIIALAAVLVLGGGGAAAWFFLSGSSSEDPDAPKVEVKRPAIYVKLRTLEGRPMFVASMQSSSGQRHLMQIYAEAKTRDPAVEQALNQHMPLVVARLNTLFTTADPESLRLVEGKRALQQQATAIVQEVMSDKAGNSGVEIVLFTSIVMQ
jgi:flagellar protein FliL